MAEADFTDISASASLSTLHRQINARSTALRSRESATAFPSDTTPGQQVFRTDIGWVFERNQADDAWIAMWEVDNGPWAPLRVAIDVLVTPSWVASTELAADPGGGIEVEGVDLFLVVSLSVLASGQVIKLPDVAAWASRKVWVTLISGFGDEISIQNESDDSVICEITTIGDSVLLQADSAGVWTPVVTNLNGNRTISSSLNLDTDLPFQWWHTNIFCQTATGSLTVTLPAISRTNVQFSFPMTIKKLDATANTVTILPAVGATTPTIEGAASKVLSSQFDAITVVPDEPNNIWHIVSFVGTASAPAPLLSVISKTANYTAGISDDVISCDSTGGAFTITLPTAASSTGHVFYIKKAITGGSPITVDANASELIDGALTSVLAPAQPSLTIVSDGTGWLIL